MEWLRKLFSYRRTTSTGKVVGRSFVVSLAVHLVLFSLAGAWVISRAYYNKESTFVGQPPPSRTYDPRQLEFKVKVSKQQRSSSRPSMAPRLVAMKASALALPEIKIDAKVVKTSFQPKFKSVGGTGLGVGLGTGYGVGGFGTGVSQFDFFGIRGRGDRIAILVDVSVSMIEDEKGGPAGYGRVKNRINQVISEMNEAAMFNVIVFADATSRWQDKMVIASEENRRLAKEWLDPFNTNGNEGLAAGNFAGLNTSVPSLGGTTRLDEALAAAYEGGADTILVISDGLPKVEKGVSATQSAAYKKELDDFNRKHARENAAAAREVARETPRAPEPAGNERWEDKKVWIPDQPAVPRREGQPGRAAVKGHFETQRVQVGGKPHPPPAAGGHGGPAAPPPPQAEFWTLADFVRHCTDLQAKCNEPKGRKPPVIHCIGYQIDNEGGKFLQGLTAKYQGRYRRIGKME